MLSVFMLIVIMLSVVMLSVLSLVSSKLQNKSALIENKNGGKLQRYLNPRKRKVKLQQ
jgi:hypothetical protein